MDNGPQVIYLVRHATPERKQPAPPYHIPPGPALSETGLREARQAGEFLAAQEISCLYTSPLERCIRTAQIVAEITGTTISIVEELIEVQPSESSEVLKARTLNAFEAACRSMDGNSPIVLVSHGGPIAALLSALGMEAQEMANWKAKFDTSNPLPPAGIWRASRQTPEDPWLLEFAFSPQED